MKARSFVGIILVGLSSWLAAQESGPLYENNFEKAAVGKVPDDLLILDGGFAVKEEGGNKVLELPGAPLDTYGVLFGPAEKADVAVTGRFHGTLKGRRFPAFAIGLNGVAGYKLRVSPGKKELELVKGDDIKASVPYTWTSGSWTLLRLQLRKVKEGEWRVEGRAWKQGDKEPAEWAISWTDTTEPSAGRPSVWGNPYAGTPIQFDDLVFTRVAAKP
jgi:hypothetical protein